MLGAQDGRGNAVGEDQNAPQDSATLNVISGQIVDAAIEVHRVLGGPGLLERVYEDALVLELRERGLSVDRQVLLSITYKGHEVSAPLRLDLLVERSVIVEAKATPTYSPIYTSQALTHLRVSGLKLALVINFGERYVKSGIHRVVNNL